MLNGSARSTPEADQVLIGSFQLKAINLSVDRPSAKLATETSGPERPRIHTLACYEPPRPSAGISILKAKLSLNTCAQAATLVARTLSRRSKSVSAKVVPATYPPCQATKWRFELERTTWEDVIKPIRQDRELVVGRDAPALNGFAGPHLATQPVTCTAHGESGGCDPRPCWRPTYFSELLKATVTVAIV